MNRANLLHANTAIQPTSGLGMLSADYVKCAENLIEHGYSVIRLPVYLQREFWDAIDVYPVIPRDLKGQFSYPERTDGFMPFGMEYANSTNNVDLCERFCYRDKHRLDHRNWSFSDHPFYRHIAGFESGISAMAEQVMEQIERKFSYAEPIETRRSSYLQFCAYNKEYRKADREYLQDRHEDGHLITFVKASRDGLVIFPNGKEERVILADDEIIVFTGSLLTALSDGRIPHMDHAVLNPLVQVERSSIVYFVIPELKRNYTSFVEGRKLDLEEVANRNHESFGNIPFTLVGQA